MPEQRVQRRYAIASTERHHRLIEELRLDAPRRVTAAALAGRLGVSARTIERDVARLRDAGVPITAHHGADGGYTLAVRSGPGSVTLTPAEAGALVAALVAFGPLSSASAQSAHGKLLALLAD